MGVRTPRAVQLIKLLPTAATWSNCTSNCWDPKVEVRVSFPRPTVDWTWYLIFNDLDLVNEKMWHQTCTNVKYANFDHQTKMNNNKNVTQKGQKVLKINQAGIDDSPFSLYPLWERRCDPVGQWIKWLKTAHLVLFKPESFWYSFEILNQT